MPKITKRKTKSAKTAKQQKNSIWDIFRFGESYTSLILGIIVVVIATVLLLTFIKGKNSTKLSETKQQAIAVQTAQNTTTPKETQNLPKNEQINTTTNPQTEANQTSNQKISGTTYSVREGDSLWKIAENKYQSGYNWVDIQKANNLANANILYAGTKLTLPNVEPKIATVVKLNSANQQVGSTIQTNKISGSTYTVSRGDTLWDIAVRAYGDGYAWSKLARVNNLSNPNLIYSGNKITIPRG
jgi:putative chitinase